MAVSAVFDLIDALVAQLPGVVPTGVQVFDGYPDTDDPPSALLCVGVPDPSDENAATSASGQQDWANANYTARDEEGDVFCAAQVTDGDGSLSTARSELRALVQSVETLLRSNPSLGVPSLLWTSFGTSTDLLQDQGQDGATAILTFSVHYRARI